MQTYDDLKKIEKLKDPEMVKVHYNHSLLRGLRDRVSLLFDEFPTLLFSWSGGKDSSTVLEALAAEARRRNFKLALELNLPFLQSPEFLAYWNTRHEAKCNLAFNRDPDWMNYDDSWVHFVSEAEWNTLLNHPKYSRFYTFTVLWETQWRLTHEHQINKMNEFIDVTIPYICAIPITTYNANSLTQTEYTSYDPTIQGYDKEKDDCSNWVIPKPNSPFFHVIRSWEFFPAGVANPKSKFEDFVPSFQHWFCQNFPGPVVSVTGVRAVGESLSRWAKLSNTTRGKSKGYTDKKGLKQDWIMMDNEKDNLWSAIPIFNYSAEDDFRYMAQVACPRVERYNSFVK